MNCPKCGSCAVSIEKLSDHPASVFRCICGYHKMSIMGKPDKVIEQLPLCRFCKKTRVKHKKSKFCSVSCYAASMRRVVPKKGSSIKGAKKRGRRDFLAGKSIRDCPYQVSSYISSAYMKAWKAGFRGGPRFYATEFIGTDMKIYMVLNVQELSGESVVGILTTEKEAESLVKIKISEGVSSGSHYEVEEIDVHKNAEQVIDKEFQDIEQFQKKI